MPYMSRHRKGYPMKIPNGLKVSEPSTTKVPKALPRFLRDAATERGYGDAMQPLSLYIHEGDVTAAFDCAAHGDGSMCVMAQAGKRIGAKAVYFYRTVAWVDFGQGPVVRFRTSRSIYNNVIEPFDRGDREGILTGIYHLVPPSASKTLDYDRQRLRGRSGPTGVVRDGSRSVLAHTERVVMAANVSDVA